MPAFPPPPGASPPPAKPHESAPLDVLLAIMSDPRNAWMGAPGKFVEGAASLPMLVGGLGRLFNSGRGWEVLREYMAKGGTPQSLRDILRKRGYDFETTGKVSREAQMGTDIAAPPAGTPAMIRERAIQANEAGQRLRERYPESVSSGGISMPGDQQNLLAVAAHRLRAERPAQPASIGITRAVEVPSSDDIRSIPSGVLGQGAYNAISSRMAHLMDDPAFRLVKQHFDLPPVSDNEYYRALPIETVASIMNEFRGTPAVRPNMRVLTQAERDVLTPEQFAERIGRPDLNRPQSFRASENQRTADLNRRADQNQ